MPSLISVWQLGFTVFLSKGTFVPAKNYTEDSKTIIITKKNPPLKRGGAEFLKVCSMNNLLPNHYVLVKDAEATLRGKRWGCGLRKGQTEARRWVRLSCLSLSRVARPKAG